MMEKRALPAPVAGSSLSSTLRLTTTPVEPSFTKASNWGDTQTEQPHPVRSGGGSASVGGVSGRPLHVFNKHSRVHSEFHK